MIDTHGHLNLDPLYDDWQKHLDQAINTDVNHIVIPGTDLDSSQKALDIAGASNHCSAMVGLHPHLATDIVSGKISLSDQIKQLAQLANDNNIVAIGEIGLDYFRPKDSVEDIKQIQCDLFASQLKLANDINLPVSIHVRDAGDDALDLIKQFKPFGTLHCFSGDKEYLKSALNLGLHISFAGNLTFKNAASLQSLIKLVPGDRLLLETDAPYLNPNRGQFPNTPANVSHIYHFASLFLDKPHHKLINQIDQNAIKLFKIQTNDQ